MEKVMGVEEAMAGKRRGVGYCINPSCSARHQIFTLLDLPDRFDCPACLVPGRIERERAMHPPGLTSFDEVRVEYDFDPDRGIYRASARVLDPNHLTHDVYTLQSPLIHTREHALAVGRQALTLLYRRSLAARKTPLPSRAELVAQGWPVMV